LQKRSMLRRATIASSEIVEPEIGRMVVMSASPEFFCVHSFRAGVCGPSNERTNTLSIGISAPTRSHMAQNFWRLLTLLFFICSHGRNAHPWGHAQLRHCIRA
jgi:hypothetical protein